MGRVASTQALLVNAKSAASSRLAVVKIGTPGVRAVCRIGNPHFTGGRVGEPGPPLPTPGWGRLSEAEDPILEP